MVEKRYGLIFPGQGSQSIGMGKELYEMSAAARWVFDRADEITGMEIKKMCFDGPEEELMTTINSQPAIFVTSIAALNALVERVKGNYSNEYDGNNMLSRDDVSRIGSISMGLSLGEPTALVAAGAMSFEDGLKFVQKRGEFMDEASRKQEGSMASILGLDLEEVEKICKGVGCQVANLNCPGQVVISGASSRVKLASELALNSGAKRAIPLKVSGAFHSDLMVPAKEQLKEMLETIDIAEPGIDFISNIDGKVTRDPLIIKQNLADQLDHRTLWEVSVLTAREKGILEYLEIGPGTVLKGLLKKIDKELKVTPVHTMDDIESIGY